MFSLTEYLCKFVYIVFLFPSRSDFIAQKKYNIAKVINISDYFKEE